MKKKFSKINFMRKNFFFLMKDNNQRIGLSALLIPDTLLE